MKNKDIDIVDFHSHTLPCLDHGSRSLQTSITQLEYAKSHGVSRVLSTPHFYPHAHTLADFLEKRRRSVRMLFDSKSDDLPDVKIAAEVLLCSGLENMSGLDKLCLYGTDYILLELPFSNFRDEYIATVRRLMGAGLKVILAHADRYPPENIERMLDAGVNTIQINASALCTLIFNKNLFDWLKRGVVACIGSDIHSTDISAYKKFSKAKSKLGEFASQIKNKSDSIWDMIADFNE